MAPTEGSFAHGLTFGSPRSGTPVVPNLTSIVVLALNQWHHTEACLTSLLRWTPEPNEIIVVDNGSTDGTLAHLRAFVAAYPQIRVVANPSNLGFAGGNNQGLALARGEYALLLNNDTIVTDGWLARMISVLHRDSTIGLVGPMSGRVSGPQMIPDVPYRDLDQLQVFARDWGARHNEQTMPATRLVGFCLLIRRAVIDAIGGLDESFGTGNFEDDDYCFRAHLSGFRMAIALDSFVHHVGGQTFVGERIDYSASMQRNWGIFKQKWGIPADTQLGANVDVQVGPRELERLRMPLQPVAPDLVLQATPTAAACVETAKRHITAGNWAEAEAALGSALASEPEAVNARYLLGCAQLQLGRPEQALEAFRAATAAVPDNSDFQNALGSALKELGKHVEAAAAFERSLELDGNNLDAWVNLAEVHVSLGDVAKARRAWSAAQHISADDPQVVSLEAVLAHEPA